MRALEIVSSVRQDMDVNFCVIEKRTCACYFKISREIILLPILKDLIVLYIAHKRWPVKWNIQNCVEKRDYNNSKTTIINNLYPNKQST